jgi:protein-S-isoprenylcysteine O-methyltransferase Ste14
LANVDEDSVRAAIRDEVERAIAVERERFARVARALVPGIAAFFVLYLGAVFVVLMAVYILGARFEPWIGAAAVGSTVVALGLVLSWWAWRAIRRSLAQ